MTPLYLHRDPEFGANRPYPLDRWVAAKEAWIEEDWLVYPLTGLREIDPSKSVLDEFLALSTAEDAVHFATECGVLGFCDHGLPLTHAIGPDGGPCPEFRVETRPTGLVALERVEAWLIRSNQAEQLLRLAVDLNDSRDGDPRIWTLALGDVAFPWAAEQLKRPRLLQQRRVLADLVNQWVQPAGVGFKVVPSEQGLSIVIQGKGVMGALAVQLMAAVAKKKGLAICSYCSAFYTPEKRLPKSTQLNYCPQCREDGAPVRVAKRLQRERLAGRGHDRLLRRNRAEVAAAAMRIVEEHDRLKSMVRERLLAMMTRKSTLKDGE